MDMSSNPQATPMNVRAIYRATAIPDSPAPHDRASLKVFYPDNYGKRPSATAIGPILAELRSINARGVLGGHPLIARGQRR
jgi:hypothetical protein